jgi:molybdopterin/thiamine biosynthesis adenylyltransferase
MAGEVRMLSGQELSRYERQLLIAGWGKEGQERLKKAEVLVAGAGGLGSAILIHLAAAGVGRIRIIDSDRVELSNLNRQTLYSINDIGKEKATAAKGRLALLNPDIEIEALAELITEKNVFDLVAHYPIVDAMDNLPTRYLLNQVAVSRQLPLFHGAVYGFEGSATTIMPTQTPCLRCLYQGVLPGKIPVVGVTPAVIGCVQATEVIKYLIGMGELLTGRLLVYDGLSMRFSEARVKKDPNCEACGPSRPLDVGEKNES